MSQEITRAVYELGNPLMANWIRNFDSSRGIFPGPPIPLLPNNRIIVLFDPSLPLGYELIKYVVSDQKLTTSNVDYYMYKETDDVPTLFQNYYNKGYRFFIGTQDSATLESLVPFFTNKQDCLYINTFSTIYNLSMPPNMIRSCVNDYTLTSYINNYFILYLPELLNLTGDELLYDPLSTVPVGTPAFQKIVYIYQESNYTTEFLNMLEQTQDPSLNLNIPIESYLITDSSDGFPPELITLLTENPVSGVNYKNSEKTLFIVNSSIPENMLALFDDAAWYDNFFFFCDPFFADLLQTKYPFLYCFIGAGSYSSVGYKLSQFVDPNQDISPVALGVVDLILQLGQWYLNNDTYGTTMQDLFNKLIQIQYLYNGNDNNWYWYVKQIYIYHTTYDLIDPDQLSYNILKIPCIFNASASPTQNGAVSSQTYGASLLRPEQQYILSTTPTVPNGSSNSNVILNSNFYFYTYTTATGVRPNPSNFGAHIFNNMIINSLGFKFPAAPGSLLLKGNDESIVFKIYISGNNYANMRGKQVELFFWRVNNAVTTAQPNPLNIYVSLLNQDNTTYNVLTITVANNNTNVVTTQPWYGWTNARFTFSLPYVSDSEIPKLNNSFFYLVFRGTGSTAQKNCLLSNFQLKYLTYDSSRRM